MHRWPNLAFRFGEMVDLGLCSLFTRPIAWPVRMINQNQIKHRNISEKWVEWKMNSKRFFIFPYKVNAKDLFNPEESKFWLSVIQYIITNLSRISTVPEMRPMRNFSWPEIFAHQSQYVIVLGHADGGRASVSTDVTPCEVTFWKYFCFAF